MADNYLEKQYEDYQAKKAAWEWERKYGKKNKKAVPKQPEPVLPPHPDDADFIEEEGRGGGRTLAESRDGQMHYENVPLLKRHADERR